jgi:hypothetical protein
MRSGVHLVLPSDQRLFLLLRIVGPYHGPVIAEFPYRRGVCPQLEPAALLKDEDAPSHERRNRFLCGPKVILVVEAGIVLPQRQLPIRPDLDERDLEGWMDLNQRASRPEQPVDLLKGMDHALLLHSAERPGQQPYVEHVGVAGGCEVLEGHVPEVDREVCRTEPLLGPLDRVFERINRRHMGGSVPVPPGEPTVTASDLQDLTALQLDEVEQRVSLVALGIGPYRQNTLPQSDAMDSSFGPDGSIGGLGQ